jgi:hypothetical protein
MSIDIRSWDKLSCMPWARSDSRLAFRRPRAGGKPAMESPPLAFDFGFRHEGFGPWPVNQTVFGGQTPRRLSVT